MGLFKRLMIALLFIFLLSSLIKNFIEYRKNYSFYEEFRNEYEKTKRENIIIKTQIIKNNDIGQIEKTIRDRLNLLKPNEIALIIPNPTPTPIVVTPIPFPVYKQWWNIFFQN